jgi:hypothetical protein
MAPVKEAMDIIQRISNLPRAEKERSPAPKKPPAKSTKKS